jgi:hypothetical protein
VDMLPGVCACLLTIEVLCLLAIVFNHGNAANFGHDWCVQYYTVQTRSQFVAPPLVGVVYMAARGFTSQRYMCMSLREPGIKINYRTAKS